MIQIFTQKYQYNSIRYSGLNLFYNWDSIKSKSPKDVAIETQITDNIGMFIDLTKVKNLNTDKLTFLFIDNSEYLTFLGSQEVCTNGNKYKAYEYDLEHELNNYSDRTLNSFRIKNEF